jgi:hypothetical protein
MQAVCAAPLELVARKNIDFCHFPLSADEAQTVDAVIAADPNCDIVLAPTHHVDAEGMFHGFRVAYPPRTAGVLLPINREMFFGHTVVEVGAAGDAAVNPDVMRLAGDPARCRALMAEFLAETEAAATGHEPGLHCVPCNVQAWDSAHEGGVAATRLHNAEDRATDSAPWQPELPARIGVYHAFVRGFSKDVREHKIFLAVSGGCTLAAESYYNLLLDLGTNSDVDEICDAEETFWLRQASYRARCRLLAALAAKFGLAVKTIADINSYDERPMALATTDTVYNNVARLRSGHVAVFSECVDTTTSRNGIVNALHPAEGLWIFRGAARASGGACHLGLGFGDQRTCGIFPTGSFEVVRREGRPRGATGFSTVTARAAAHVVSHRGDGAATGRLYSWPDERFFDTLRAMGWDRNNGIVELIPIVVGVSRG